MPAVSVVCSHNTTGRSVAMWLSIYYHMLTALPLRISCIGFCPGLKPDRFVEAGCYGLKLRGCFWTPTSSVKGLRRLRADWVYSIADIWQGPDCADSPCICPFHWADHTITFKLQTMGAQEDADGTTGGIVFLFMGMNPMGIESSVQYLFWIL